MAIAQNSDITKLAAGPAAKIISTLRLTAFNFLLLTGTNFAQPKIKPLIHNNKMAAKTDPYA